MSTYRVELAPTGRATCKATHCQKEKVKIEKGALRHGVQVTINEHTSWHWRHWGCVTPEVLHNWVQTCEMNMDLVDGYDELPEADQKKVKRALEQEHVDDADWNGDVEMNRYDPNTKRRGMFVKTPKKKAKEDSDDEAETSPTKKKANKKRGRADEDGDEEPAPKKTKGKAKKAAKDADADEDEAPKKATKKGKTTKEPAVDEKDAAPPKKSTKGKKARSEEKTISSDTIQDDEPPVPQKKSRAKKNAAPVEDDAVPEEASAPPKKRKGRAKKTAAEDA